MLFVTFGLGAMHCGVPVAMDAGREAAVTDAGLGGDVMLPVAASCAASDEAPIRDGLGGFRCTRVGATGEPSVLVDGWPDAAGTALPQPFLYVRLGAAAGGDGSSMRPFGEIAAALAATPAAGTIVIAAGTYALTRTLMVDRTVTFLGAGTVAGTTVRGPRGAPAFTSSTTGVRVTMLRLAIGHDAPPDALDIGIAATAGATLSLRGVAIDGSTYGLRIGPGATLIADGLSVRNAGFAGVALEAGSRGILRDVLLRDGGYGIFAVEARVHLSRALVADNRLRGILMQGTPTPAMSGALDCLAADLTVASGTLECFSEVAIERNRNAGMDVRGSHSVEMRLVSLSGTLTSTSGDGMVQGGDGLMAFDGAQVSIDPEINSAGRRGLGSEIVGNARGGVVVQGARSSAQIRGAVVSANAGPGLFFATGATARMVGFNQIDSNSGFGLAATASATVVQIECNGFIATRPAMLQTTGGSLEGFADGLFLSNGGGPSAVNGNEFGGNDRFSAVFHASSGTVTNNTGGGNGFELGVYVSPGLTLSGNSVTGRAPAPEIPPSPPSGQL